RINGLKDQNDVKKIVFETSYIVFGLGDVYLGAPCAVPVDPRHRLITSKYNPARTFTTDGTVGIGGVYMCIYPRSSPGGYQIIGRSLPVWNTYLNNKSFKNDKPWLLRFFDQVRFYEVTEDELLEMRKGKKLIQIEEDQFDYAKYLTFLSENEHSINELQAKQKVAFDNEVLLWEQDDHNNVNQTKSEQEEEESKATTQNEVLKGRLVSAITGGRVLNVLVKLGQRVKLDEPLLVVEAMKMELTIYSELTGIVNAVYCEQGKMINTADI
ncbi:unnamed protein product, partial [Didymodactylos carnosus]